VSTLNTVPITATLNGVSRSATLTVNAGSTSTATLGSLSFPTSTIQGSGSLAGTVTLATTATTLTTIALSSSNPSVASVPASVSILAGANTATVLVTASAVNANTSVTITASLNGTTRSVTLTLQPPAQQAGTPTGVWRGFAGGSASTNCTGGFADIVIYENDVPGTGTFVQCDTAGNPLAYIAATITGRQASGNFGGYTLTATIQLSTGPYTLSAFLNYLSNGVLFANTSANVGGPTYLGGNLAPGQQRTVTLTLGPFTPGSHRITVESPTGLSILCRQGPSFCAPLP